MKQVFLPRMVGSFNKENVLCQVQHCRCQTLPNTAYAPDLTRMTRLHAAAGWVQEASSWVAWSSVALSASTHPLMTSLSSLEQKYR